MFMGQCHTHFPIRNFTFYCYNYSSPGIRIACAQKYKQGEKEKSSYHIDLFDVPQI